MLREILTNGYVDKNIYLSNKLLIYYFHNKTKINKIIRKLE